MTKIFLRTFLISIFWTVLINIAAGAGLHNGKVSNLSNLKFNEKKDQPHGPVLHADNNYYEENEEEINDDADFHLDLAVLRNFVLIEFINTETNFNLNPSLTYNSQPKLPFSQRFILFRNLRN